MSQERWDIVLRFLNGPLAYQADMVLRGPVVRIGANPGPATGGSSLKLEGYRGLDDRQAVITVYDGATVQVAPVGAHQVRTAPHEHVNWEELLPIRGPVFLSNGGAIHFGPPGRGATCIFVEARRLGTWEQRAILSDASQGAEATSGKAEVKAASAVQEIDASSRFPWWLLPGFFGIGSFFMCGLGGLVFLYYQRDVRAIGPVDEGVARYETIEEVTAVAEKVTFSQTTLDGVEQAFFYFVMEPNADAAGKSKLKEDRKLWDQNLLAATSRYVTVHAQMWQYWVRLDRVRNEWAQVLTAARKKGLPDVVAAIPFQESGYTSAAQSFVCAKGWWQFLPETAIQADLKVAECRLLGSPDLWTPTAKAPPIGVLKNATYISEGKCLIPKDGGCQLDERTDLALSTRGALQLLAEPFLEDDELRASGAVVQLMIASHNCGYDNSRFYPTNRVNMVNIRPSYLKYLKDKGVAWAPDFHGVNMTCTSAQTGAYDPNEKCGQSYVVRETQQYVPVIIAHQILAACYYGLNYGDMDAFDAYESLSGRNGYCKSIRVPTKEQVSQHYSKGG